jgi:hypothetical protein
LDELDERHQGRRVEEVHADDTLGSGRRSGDLGHRERGGVGREDRIRPADPVELREDRALGLELLHDRLDHQVAAGEHFKLCGDGEPCDCSVALSLFELPLLDLAGEEMADPACCRLGELGSHLASDRVVASLDRELRDPGTHRAEADHADRADLHHRRDPSADTPRPALLQPTPRARAAATNGAAGARRDPQSRGRGR